MSYVVIPEIQEDHVDGKSRVQSVREGLLSTT